MKFRYSILAAVSSDEQTDKASIPSQLAIAREAGERLGGTFISEYILDGYSRTGYYSLPMACDDIPPLAKCINDMPKYDVLIVKNYDRLGSLGMMIYNLFCQHRKQLYSVQQSTTLYEPSEFVPGQDTSTAMMINVASISQVYRIAKIADAFRTGNPARAKDGYFVIRVPQGYTRVDKYNVAVDAKIAAVLVNFPKWFLAGESVREIARRANEIITSKNGKPWNFSTVAAVLKNPFYAGKTYYGRHESRNGKRTNYRLKKKYPMYDGKHEALWDFETYQRIMAEFERRRIPTRVKTSLNLSGLLYCSECGSKLWIKYNSRYPIKYWCCKNEHIRLRHDEANKLVAAEIRRMYQTRPRSYKVDAEEVKDLTKRELTQLRSAMLRTEKAFESGAYTPEEYAEKRKAMKAREAELLDEQAQKQEAITRNADRQRVAQSITELLPHIEEWISNDEPRTVRFLLSRVLRFKVSPDKTITGEWV